MNDTILPKIREDIVIRTNQDADDGLLIFVDPVGLMQEDIAIPAGFLPLIQMLDGNTSLEDIKEFLDTHGVNSEEIVPLFGKVVKILDDYAMLETDKYYDILDELDSYYASPVRHPALSGIAYSKIVPELQSDLDRILNHYPGRPAIESAKAVIVPHIDFFTGGATQNCYSLAYKAIENTPADLYIILGTSHYYSTSEYMLTLKDYQTPFGTIATDKEVIDEMAKIINIDSYINENSHRLEHSVELQTVLIQHKFSNKSFRILPILCGLPNRIEQTNDDFIEALVNSVKALGRKAVYIVSADLGHIGAKHNSQLNASDSRAKLERYDRDLINAICKLDKAEFNRLLISENRRWQICGESPINSILSTNLFSEAKLEYYGQSTEYEFDSAVSYATISFQ